MVTHVFEECGACTPLVWWSSWFLQSFGIHLQNHRLSQSCDGIWIQRVSLSNSYIFTCTLLAVISILHDFIPTHLKGFNMSTLLHMPFLLLMSYLPIMMLPTRKPYLVASSHTFSCFKQHIHRYPHFQSLFFIWWLSLLFTSTTYFLMPRSWKQVPWHLLPVITISIYVNMSTEWLDSRVRIQGLSNKHINKVHFLFNC